MPEAFRRAYLGVVCLVLALVSACRAATSATVVAADATSPILEVVSAGQVVSEITYGAPIAIRVRRLRPAEHVTLRSQASGFGATAEFVVPADGTVDTRRDAPIAGSYDGVEADGLVWSMQRQRDAPDASHDLSFVVERHGARATQAVLRRKTMAADATFVALAEHGLVGTLLVPARAARPPVVVVLGGSEGGRGGALWTAAYAETFGVAALALAYFGEPGLPGELHDIPIEYVQRAIDWVAARPEVDPTRIVVWGGSRGSELALEIAARDPRIKGVIAEAPSPVRWAGDSIAGGAAWTFAGAPMAHLGATAEPRVERLADGRTGYRFSSSFVAALDAASAEQLQAATIAAEHVAGPILFLAGDDDGVWPACRLVDQIWTKLVASGHVVAHGDGRHCFAAAGHGVGPMGGATSEALTADTGGVTLILGGTARGVAHAQHEGYQLLTSFFAQIRAAPRPRP